MNNYLKFTEFCDCDHQEIIDKAEELTRNDESPEGKALSIFYFVRDQIPFKGGAVVRASETLKIGNGFCVTKSNLQVALLRAVKIPARYHVAYLKKDILKGVVSGIHSDRFHEIITYHPWCECYLSEKWISCDALYEKTLVKKLFDEGIQSKTDIPTIDWDGKNDLNTAAAWMIEDKGTYDSLDELFSVVKNYFASGMVGLPPTQ